MAGMDHVTRRRLTREKFFEIVAEELFRKGSIDPLECLILQRLTRFLQLKDEVILAIARAAQEKGRRIQKTDIGPFDPRVAYTGVLCEVLAYGALGPRELQMLEAFRILLRLPEGLHERLIGRTRDHRKNRADRVRVVSDAPVGVDALAKVAKT